METCFEYCEKGEGWFSSDEPKWIKKIQRLKVQYPDLVEIKKMPSENGGCIYCRVPSSWLKIQPKKSKAMTDEQRIAIGKALYEAKQLKAAQKQLSDDSAGNET